MCRVSRESESERVRVRVRESPGVCVLPPQHHVEQGVAYVLAGHCQRHQLHTGDVQGVGGRVGELVEPPVTVGEGTGGLARHRWSRG